MMRIGVRGRLVVWLSMWSFRHLYPVHPASSCAFGTQPVPPMKTLK